MSRRHLIWKVVNFLMSLFVTGQVSAPYRRIDITSEAVTAKDLSSPNLVHCPGFLYPGSHFLPYLPSLLDLTSYCSD